MGSTAVSGLYWVTWDPPLPGAAARPAGARRELPSCLPPASWSCPRELQMRPRGLGQARPWSPAGARAPAAPGRSGRGHGIPRCPRRKRTQAGSPAASERGLRGASAVLRGRAGAGRCGRGGRVCFHLLETPGSSRARPAGRGLHLLLSETEPLGLALAGRSRGGRGEGRVRAWGEACSPAPLSKLLSCVASSQPPSSPLLGLGCLGVRPAPSSPGPRASLAGSRN